MRRPLAALWLLVTACAFDATGLGEGGGSITSVGASGAVPETTGGATSPLEPTTEPGDDLTTDGVGMTDSGSTTGGPDPTTGPPDPTIPDPTIPDPTIPDPTLDATTDPTTLPPDDSTTTTGDPPVCDPAAYKVVLLVQDAAVADPMKSGMSPSEPEEGTIAYSGNSGQGTVTFSFEVPCDGEYAVWGRVRDDYPGPGQGGPDSFFARADGGGEDVWFYGCQFVWGEDEFEWKRVRDNEYCVGGSDFTPFLTAGPHTITLRNREGSLTDGNKTEYAVVARLVVTGDLGYEPQGE